MGSYLLKLLLTFKTVYMHKFIDFLTLLIMSRHLTAQKFVDDAKRWSKLDVDSSDHLSELTNVYQRVLEGTLWLCK